MRKITGNPVSRFSNLSQKTADLRGLPHRPAASFLPLPYKSRARQNVLYPIDFSTTFMAMLGASILTALLPIPMGLGSFEAGLTAMLSLLGVPVHTALAGTLLARGFTLWLPLLPWLGGVDKFRSATAGGQSRQCKEARRSNIGNIVSRADVSNGGFGSSPEGVAL